MERPDAGTIVWSGTEVTALHGRALTGYRLRDGAVVDELDLVGGYPVDDVIRSVSHLG
jgi:hypothetical protein